MLIQKYKIWDFARYPRSPAVKFLKVKISETQIEIGAISIARYHSRWRNFINYYWKQWNLILLLTRRVSLLIKVPVRTPRDLWFTNLCKFWHTFPPIQIKYVKCWLTFWPIEIKYVNSKWHKQRCEAATSIWKMTLLSCCILLCWGWVG